MEYSYALVAAVVVMSVSLAGVIFSSSILSAWTHRHLTYLATFSAGVFLMVVYHLLEEMLHEGDALALAAGAVLFGAALMEALHHLLPAEHHHHEAEHDHAHTSVDGRRVLVSDALHNVGDGILLVAAFATNWAIGIAATIGIVVHELVQEISEFFVLKEAGYTTQRALGLNVLSSSTILIGVGVASFLSSSEVTALLFAGLAAGGFLAVLLRDLLPHAIDSIKQHGGGVIHLGALVLGVCLMLGVQTLFSHEETEEAHGGEITSSPQNRDTLN
jgi:zinc and cadmium transporter